MAKRRMFSIDVTESELFFDLPFSSQALYLHLCMNADDDGFLGSVRNVCLLTGASVEDMNPLIENEFVIVFKSKVVVIRDWPISNNVPKERYTPTSHREEWGMLKPTSTEDSDRRLKNGPYQVKTEYQKNVIHNVTELYNNMSTQERFRNSIGTVLGQAQYRERIGIGVQGEREREPTPSQTAYTNPHINMSDNENAILNDLRKLNPSLQDERLLELNGWYEGLWNEMPDNIRTKTDTDQFKHLFFKLNPDTLQYADIIARYTNRGDEP